MAYVKLKYVTSVCPASMKAPKQEDERKVSLCVYLTYLPVHDFKHCYQTLQVLLVRIALPYKSEITSLR